MPLEAGAVKVTVMVWLPTVAFAMVGDPGGRKDTGVTTSLEVHTKLLPDETRSQAGSVPMTMIGLAELAVDVFCAS